MMAQLLNFSAPYMPQFCRQHPLVLVASVVLAWGTPLAVQAQMFSDPALEALYLSDRFEVLERQGQQRLAAQPDDAQGVLAMGLAALRLQAGAAQGASRRKAAIAAAERCVQQQPQQAACHYVLGAVTGIQAASDGLMALAGSAGKVKNALLQAMSLAPQWTPARSAVVEFYTVAPGIAGGSTRKALEAARAAPNPVLAKALEARVALQDEAPEQVLTTLQALNPGSDTALASDLLGWQRAAVFALVNDGQAAKAKPAVEKLLRSHGDRAWVPFAMGRVLTDAGAPLEALKHFDAAAKLPLADELPLVYRIGIAQQAAGQKDAARESFKRYVAAGKGSKGNLEDAKKRLAELGG
jgi:hypothetical protein